MTIVITVLLVLLSIMLWIGIRPLRRATLSRVLLHAFRKVLPAMTDTERDALAAGTVWWEGELFRGNPDWRRLHAYPAPRLDPREQAFLDQETDNACRMVDDWHVTRSLHDLPVETWDYIKQAGFLGMIIPRAYGGLGFSAFAHSQVVTKLSTRSSALAVSVMVPNSLGPAELLLHYGTEEQKSHYLPRLASGQDIPAFALTSPWAGSDAASIPDTGRVCRGVWMGREVVGMSVSWDKRYITLAPICTLLGLAFRLYDPDGLLGGKAEIGMTCALVPRDHPGVECGRRHAPLNAMFMNGPTRGNDVFMPLDFIIGGPAMAGHGWRMLMQCLAAGRGISLPSASTGMSKLTARGVGGYARVRRQFGTAIGRFEGVEEPLARIAGHTYAMDAARIMTAGAIDLGEQPSVVSAIVKYHVTERARQVVNDGMDILGGKGICLGPSNFLGHAYQQAPISITVEGANILTRSLIVFGQGAVRCHPYVLREVLAANDPDPVRGLAAFDRAIWAHLAYAVGNGLRAGWRALTAGRLVAVRADTAPEMRPYYRALSRLSSAYALLADVSLLYLGGSIKRREKLSGRMGDILSQMYLMSAVLKRFEDEGRQPQDAVLAHWALRDGLHQARQAFDGMLMNYPSRILAAALRLLVFPWGLPWAAPDDELGHKVARLLLVPGRTRDRLTAGCYLPATSDEPLGAIEQALAAAVQAEPIEARIRQAVQSGSLPPSAAVNVRDLNQTAHAHGIVSDDEYAILKRRDALRDIVIRVDDFAVRPDMPEGARTAPAAMPRPATYARPPR